MLLPSSIFLHRKWFYRGEFWKLVVCAIERPKMPKILSVSIFNIFEFLYRGCAGLTQISTSTRNLNFEKSSGSQKSALQPKSSPEDVKNSDAKKFKNFNCGGASLMDLLETFRTKFSTTMCLIFSRYLVTSVFFR